MRFILLMIPKGYGTAAPGTMPPAEAVAKMMEYNKEIQDAGVLLALDGLHPPSEGTRVVFSGGKPTATDGPFADGGDVVGGYFIIKVASKQEALNWAKRCPVLGDDTIEVRQVQEFDEFPADVQAAVGDFKV